MDREEIIQLLRERLTLEIETTSEYVGSYGDSMYQDSRTLKLCLDGETISEISLN